MANTNLQIVPAGINRANDAESSGVVHELRSVYAGMEEHPAWPMIRRLPVVLGVRVPLRGFKVRDLLNLRSGQTIASTWPVTEDVPLQTGTTKISWGEFEVSEERISIRLTRLA